MLYVSESAKKQISRIKEDKKYADNSFIRVKVITGGCSGFSYQMDFDTEMQADDQVFEDKGIKLVTDPKSFMYVFNTTLDFSDGLNGKGFFFDNPNASRTCACGESFAV